MKYTVIFFCLEILKSYCNKQERRTGENKIVQLLVFLTAELCVGIGDSDVQLSGPFNDVLAFS